MAFTAADIFKRVNAILLDETNKRWPLPELLDWLNDGLREITLRAPQVVSKQVVLSLVAGTRQTLPEEYTQIVRAECNVTATGNTVNTRGVAIRPISRKLMDAQIRQWQNSAILPNTPIVSHIIDDEDDYRTYLVAPGNDGTGKIEALVAVRPAQIVKPTTDDNLIASYAALDVDLDDVHLNALCDFILSKAFIKDTNIVGGRAAAQQHYAMFAQALGIKVEVERQINPYRRKSSDGEAQ